MDSRPELFLLCCCLGSVLLVGTCCGQGHYVNVALYKNCTMSSTWSGNPDGSVTPYKTDGAVNDNTAGTFGRDNCVHTALGDRNCSWEVDLGRPYPIHKMTSYGRDGGPGGSHKRRMSNIVVTVDGQHCYTYSDYENQRRKEIACDTGVMNGTRIRLTKVTLDQSDGDYFINLCEFQVSSCSDDYWGSQCDILCGHCSEGAPCDKVKGVCESCSPGWKDSLCTQECDNGTYGQNCGSTCSTHCSDVCNKTTGHCNCEPGWQSDTCSIECNDGSYGQNCSSTCGTGCSGTCNKVDGTCSCSTGWMPPLCQQVCPNGTYGSQCQSQCGSCTGDAPCDHVTGHCALGCQAGLPPPFCQQESSDSSGGASTGIIIGSIAGAIVLIAVVIIIFFLWRRRRRTKMSGKSFREKTSSVSTTDHNRTGTSSASHITSIYENAEYLDQVDLQSDLNAQPIYSKPTPKPKSTEAVKPKTESSSPGPDAAPSDTSAYYNMANDTRNSSTSLTSLATPTPADVETDAGDSDDQLYIMPYPNKNYNDDTYMTSEGAQLKLDTVQQYLLDRLCADDFETEFKTLQQGLVRAHEVGAADENYYKNRFKSLLPYDDNRVILQGATHQDANDYINASYVRGWNSDKAYIATQGPRSNTIDDFWWMVWQLRVSHIVMLTSTIEKDRKKCEEYWPQFGVQRQCGSICVTGLHEQKRVDDVIRMFDVKNNKDGSSHKVWQYQFVTWLDHDVPSTTSVVNFWNNVNKSYRSQESAAPLLVHCSAGVGRTGTFIALDSLMQQAQHNTKIDVLQTVKELRHDRCNMIQTKDQYRLVHEAVLEAYTCHDSRIPAAALDTVLTSEVDPTLPHDYIDIQFQKLQQMKVLSKTPSLATAEEEANLNKNRDVSVLPDDKYLVHLTYYVTGRNQYINAVYTPTFYQRRGCILTQLPLQSTVIDFWRLITGDDVSMIVSLGPIFDQPEGKEYYWPTQQGQRITHGPFSITQTTNTALGPNLTSYSLTLQAENYKQRDLRLLHYSSWKGQLPDDVTDLIQLLSLLTEEDAHDASKTPAPVVLQCRDGATRSGLVRAMADIISHMMADDEVDVYTGLKHIQNIRPQCITTAAQYRYVYHVLQHYKQDGNMYQNV